MFKYSSCQEASKAGDLEELRNMHLAGCEWNHETLLNAAANGHLECLRYAHENGCKWWNDDNHDSINFYRLQSRHYYAFTTNLCMKYNYYEADHAAANGHLDCLKYIIENNGRWNENTYTPLYAVANGHSDCLRYLFEIGYENDDRTITASITNNKIECFKVCFEKYSNPQDFWILFSRIENRYPFFNRNIFNSIDLDDCVWRRLFDLDLTNLYPDLQQRVNLKKMEVQELLLDELNRKVEGPVGLLPKDVIQDCIFPYIHLIL